MNYQDLKHGDVLLFERRNHQGFLVWAIRVITGSEYTHAAVIQVLPSGERVILEQLTERTHSLANLYYNNPYKEERIHVFRPRWEIPAVKDTKDFTRYPYGVCGILDCAINHTMGILTLYNWSFRPILARLFKTQNLICSALVAKRIDLQKHVDWAEHIECVEPDDYGNHPSAFDSLGVLNWEE